MSEVAQIKVTLDGLCGLIESWIEVEEVQPGVFKIVGVDPEQFSTMSPTEDMQSWQWISPCPDLCGQAGTILVATYSDDTIQELPQRTLAKCTGASDHLRWNEVEMDFCLNVLMAPSAVRLEEAFTHIYVGDFEL